MTKSSRQAAIVGYLKRDDGVDWKGLTDYANSMYDVRDELEIADVEDNFARFKLFLPNSERIFRSFKTLLLKRASSMLMNRLPS